MRRLRLYCRSGLDEGLVRRLGMIPVEDADGWVDAHAVLRPVVVEGAASSCPAEVVL
jgi:hypothetical protein